MERLSGGDALRRPQRSVVTRVFRPKLARDRDEATRFWDFRYPVSKVASTPILDLAEPPPEPPAAWLPRAIGFIVGLAIAAILILKDQNLIGAWPGPAINALLLLPAFYVSIAFHEVGHFVAGKLVGMDAGGISVGSFVFAKSGSHWVFRFDRRRWIGGFFKPLTADTVDFRPSRFAWMVAGGPFARIVLTVLCGWYYVNNGSGYWNDLGTLFWVSLFTLIISGIPISAGVNKSDGAQLWQLIRHPEHTRAWVALLQIQTEEVRGAPQRVESRRLRANDDDR